MWCFSSKTFEWVNLVVYSEMPMVDLKKNDFEVLPEVSEIKKVF